jgi:hypothetical protein
MLNDEGEVWAIRQVWNIQGRLEADTQVEITSKINALESAYNRRVSEVALEFNNTGARTAHSMQAGNTLDGIQVIMPPSYPTSFGGEYATFRNYQIQLEGVTRVGSPLVNNIIDYQETIEVSGGHPLDVDVMTINTLPVRQRIAEATPSIVRQMGIAESYNGYPFPSLRILTIPTAAILTDRVAKTTRGQRMQGTRSRVRVYTTNWEYAFSLPTQGLSLPGPRRPAIIQIGN